MLKPIRQTLWVACMLSSACGGQDRGVRARIHIGPDQITSRVDSELAKYFAETYLKGKPGEPALAVRVDELIATYERVPLTTRSMFDLATETSNDFAALYFAHRLYRANPSLKNDAAKLARLNAGTTSSNDDFVFVFVPGLFHQSHPETKADLRDAERVLQAIGLHTARVSTGDADTVEANARRVARFVSSWRQPSKIILVSASKGSAEVHYALGALLDVESAKKITAWVSIGGALRGSQLADAYTVGWRHLALRVVAWWKGFPPEMVESLSTLRSRERLAASSLPAHVTVVQYVPVPVSGAVTEHLRADYEEMSAHGPNDGIVLLTDQLLDGAIVVPEVGVDHLFAHPKIAEKTAGLALALLNRLTSDLDE